MFVPAGSSTLVYSLLPSVVYSSFEIFWSHRDQLSSGSPPALLQYPRLSTRGEQYFSSILFPWGHLLLVFQCPGVDSRSILCQCPLPHLSTVGASPRIHLLRFEVFFCSRSCPCFHLDQYLSKFSGHRVALISCLFLHLARTIGAVSFKFSSETASAEGLASSTSRFLFLELTPLLGGVVMIITESASLSRSSSSESCLPFLQS